MECLNKSDMEFSTENLVVLLPLARSREVLERATATITLLLDEERPGSDTTHSACGDTDRRLLEATEHRREEREERLICLPTAAPKLRLGLLQRCDMVDVVGQALNILSAAAWSSIRQCKNRLNFMKRSTALSCM